MRDSHIPVAIGIVIVTLTLGLSYGPALAQRWDDWLFSIHMMDALTGWAVDASGCSGNLAKCAVESVVRTTDGGIHWRDVTPHAPLGQTIANGWARSSSFEVDWLNSFVAWVAAPLETPTHATLLFHTVDGGRTWRISPPPAVGPFRFINVRDGWMLVGHNDVYRSTDGGETWIKVASGVSTNPQSDITFLNAMTGWVTPGGTSDSESISLYVTHDGGYTWRQQNLPVPPMRLHFQFAATLPLTFFTARDGVLPVSIHSHSQSGIVLYQTHDSGSSWTYTTLTLVESYWDVAMADVDHGWVTTGDALYVTSDGGHRWTMIRPGLPFTGVAQLDFISAQVGWAAGWAGNPAFLLKTVDGGRTWESLPFTVSRQ